MNIDILCCLENYINNLIYSLYVTIIITLSVKYYVYVYNVKTAAQGPLGPITFEKRGTCIKRLFWPPVKSKNKSYSLQVSSY